MPNSGETMQEKNWLQRLTKSQDDKWIGGVCGGLGKHSSVPAWFWRFLFAFLFLFYGAGLFVYILLWIFVPGGADTQEDIDRGAG
jgi:phage shock protein PspC (stress-responsive transcriptional regulator)